MGGGGIGQMKIDVSGRVRNVQLPTSKPLLPIFESIINSIQAIEDAGESNGKIDITVIRDPNTLFSQTDQQLADISSFEIIDNGIGFDESNYEAFTTSDTTFKANRGGKGIGRFMWLAAFESVEIDSVYKSDDLTNRRTFSFCPSGAGIENHSMHRSGRRRSKDYRQADWIQRKIWQAMPEAIGNNCHAYSRRISGIFPQPYLSNYDS